VWEQALAEVLGQALALEWEQAWEEALAEV
jgi:hypothetical protein